MWQTIIIIILAIVVYDLWYKVRALQKYLEASKEITRFRIQPKPDFWSLPIMREAMGFEKDLIHKSGKDFTKTERERLNKWIRENQKAFYQVFTFFPDKELIFSSNEWGAGFARFPYKTDDIFNKELATTKDDYEITFHITVRWLKDLPEFPKQNIPVYVGYLKKKKTFSGDKDTEMVTLFELPHAFINPNFFATKNSKEMTEKLEKHFKLEPKNDDASWGDYTNDFGEQDWFSMGHWHETPYFEIHYP